MHRVFIHDNAKQFYSLYESDVCGVKPILTCTCLDKEIVESQFLKLVRSTVRQTEDGRIEVLFPWKEGFPNCLNFNRDWALAKLKQLESR